MELQFTQKSVEAAIPSVQLYQKIYYWATGLITEYVVYDIQSHPYPYLIAGLYNQNLIRTGRILPQKNPTCAGYFYDPENPEFMEAAEVMKLVENIKAKKEKKKEAEEEQKNQYQEKRNQLIAQYPHLTPRTPKDDEYKILKTNIIAQLKKYFPEYKFSIIKDGALAINIYWTNGPTVKEVENAVKMFETYSSPYCPGNKDTTPAYFTDVFGYREFVTCNRKQCQNIKELIKEIEKGWPKLPQYERENKLHQIFYRTSFPVNATNFRIERNYGNSNTDLFKIAYDLPEIPPAPTKQNIYPDILLTDYSEKSFVVHGATTPFKKELGKLGGKYRSDFRVGPGWVFSMKRKQKVKEFFASLEKKEDVQETLPVTTHEDQLQNLFSAIEVIEEKEESEETNTDLFDLFF